MVRIIAGIGVTAVALFIFGFVYWALSPLPYTSWNATADPEAALGIVKRHFPESGVYSLPGADNMELLAEGSHAMVYVAHGLSAAQPDPRELALGFLHNILMALAVFLLLRHQNGMAQYLKIGALAGLAAVVVIEGSDVTWWLYPLSWKIHGAAYHFLCFVLAAALLGKFIPARQE